MSPREPLTATVRYSERLNLDGGAFAHLLVQPDGDLSLLISDVAGVATSLDGERDDFIRLREIIRWALREQQAIRDADEPTAHA